MAKYDLVGQDGNAYNLLGYTSHALRREGLGHLVKEMTEKATSGDYSHLVVVCDEYVDIANRKAYETGWIDDEEFDDE